MQNFVVSFCSYLVSISKTTASSNNLPSVCRKKLLVSITSSIEGYGVQISITQNYEDTIKTQFLVLDDEKRATARSEPARSKPP